MMEYKKTYKWFVIWILFYTVGLTLLAVIPGFVLEDAIEAHMDLYIRAIDNAAMLLMLPLLYYIYRTGYIYLFSGMDYERALAAGDERRKAYAKKHLRLFVGFSVVYLLVSTVMQLLHIPWWVDFIFFCVGLFAICIRTMFYKL